MALQTSGAISLANIQTEFGGSNPISLSEYYGAASGIPASGAISVSSFYGTSNLQSYETTDLFGDNSGVFLFRLNNTTAESEGNAGAMTAFGGSGSINYSTDTPNSSKISHSFNQITNGRSLRTTSTGTINDSSFTISMWIKSAFHGSNDFTMFQFDDGSNVNGSWFGKANHGTQVGYFPRNTSGGGGFNRMTNGASTLLNNTWQHFMFTVNGSGNSSNFYIDNVLYSKTVGSSNPPETESIFILGIRRDQYTGNRKDFKACQIRLFNKVLSSSERSTVYNELL
jgi:hypothetical protein